MLEGGGFEVIDLGTDVSPEKFVEAIQQKGVQIVVPVGAADGDDAVDEEDHRGADGGRGAGQREGDGRRRAGDPGVRRRDRRRRLRRERQLRGGLARRLCGRREAVLVGCEVVLRELCDAVVRSPHQVDLVFLPKGLHDLGAKAMREEIQARIDAAEPAPPMPSSSATGCAGPASPASRPGPSRWSSPGRTTASRC